MSAVFASKPLSLNSLLALNPHLSLADILALWHWSGPSRRLH